MLRSRKIAATLLKKLYEDPNRTFDSVIAYDTHFKKLSIRDKNFVRLIVLTTLRRHGQIDKIISILVKKSIKKKMIKNLLRISVSQILFLPIPEYSVVHQAVEISKKYGYSKIINGILRNLCRNKKDLLSETSTEDNIPIWISSNLSDFYNSDFLRKLSSIIISEPKIEIKVKKKFAEKKNWSKIFNGTKIMPETYRIVPNRKISEIPYYEKGLWWVQGVSSMNPVNLLNSFITEKERKNFRVLDVGASPGGKTFQLMDSGYLVTSLEKSKSRMMKFKENLKRLNFSPKTILGDINKFSTNELFDCVLIDSPCTSSGLIQKNPDILISDKTEALKRLTDLQSTILSSSKKLVKKGGFMIYSVCSIIPSEGVTQIKKFLCENTNFIPCKIKKEFDGIGNVLENYFFLTTPLDLINDSEVDGFFTACLRKIKN